MRNYRCNNCDCNSFTADRALAGRLICNNCGVPLGSRSQKSAKYSTKIDLYNRKYIYVVIVLLVFALIIYR